jgi:superoxide reductase
MNAKNKHEVYKCDICGNIVEVLFAGGGELICCGEPMKLQEVNTDDSVGEKHVPVIEKTENGVRVTVGEIEHPMEEAHYIEWIEISVDGRRYKKFLQPGDNPVAEFCVEGENIVAREYCNLHGLWKKE